MSVGAPLDGVYRAIVVGSGFGGGVTACRLADEGWSVCVLERGRRFAPDDFIQYPSEAPRLLWHHKLNPNGIYDLRLMSDVAVLCAAGVGGGSLVYASVMLEAPDDVLDERWPAAIRRDGLADYYARAEEALQPRTTPNVPPLDKVRAFAAAGAGAGGQAERLPLAVHFGDDRPHPFSGVHQQGCKNLGRCNIGCPVNAMNTVALTYIARAERKGAHVLPHREVTRLEPPTAPGGNWRVKFRGLDGSAGGTVEAPIVVLSAGVLGTARILFKNRRRLNLSPALGSRFSGNGDALGAAFDSQAPGVKGARTEVGPVMTSRLDYTDQLRFMLADGGLPEGYGGLLKVARGLNAITGWRRRLVALKNLATHAGAPDQALAPRHVHLDLHDPSPITDSLVFLMIGRDPALGRVRRTWLLRRIDVKWSKHANDELFAGMRAATNAIADAAQAAGWFEPDGGPVGKFMTVHPLGGAPMADDAAEGVVDGFGKVHGHEGLYISDGSIVPTALGVNPSKTIAALAERNVADLLRTHG